ncbi:MAG: VWA domain-containing protein [Flavipsychrobacter sp.]|nr:VWA domain-containing protein [Flavipsychrobacter sp.]
MRFARGLYLFPFLFLFSIVCAKAQKAPSKQSRILILLDGSSSMVDEWNNKNSRYKAAEQVILALMDSVYAVNKDVEFGLRVFGHQHSVTERNCFDTQNEVAFSKNNSIQMSLRLNSLKPYGITPIAYSIKKAVEEDMVNEAKYVYSLILITDGGESCGGDICDVVRTLLEKKIFFKPYIISLYNSQFLAETYSCMGEYLQVLKPEDIGKTVGTIVDAYRPVIRLNETDVQQLRPLSETRTPPVTATIRTLKTEETPPPPVLKPVEKPIEKPVEAPKPQPKPVETPVVKTEERIKYTLPRIGTAGLHAIAGNTRTRPLYSTVVPPSVTIKNQQPKIEMPRLAVVGKPKTLSLLFTVPTYKEVAFPRLKMTINKPEPEIAKPAEQPKPVVTAPKPTPPKPAPPKPKTTPEKKDPPKTAEVEVKVETEDAQETTVEVYFTNGRGKYYYTMPRILFKDVKSGTTVHQFMRTIDANNRPDPHNVTPGTYNVLIAGNGNSMAKNVTITPNKKNKVLITVTTGSLHFEYANNPDRPVSEYIARVAQRSGGTDRDQPCDVDLKYEPGSYHVTVNTRPLSHFYIDLDMNYTKVITLPEPGHVRFVPADNKQTTATLYTPLGDKFVKFYGVDVGPNAPLDSLKVELKPGPYEVRFVKNPKVSGSYEQVIPFTVKSNEVIEVELK